MRDKANDLIDLLFDQRILYAGTDASSGLFVCLIPQCTALDIMLKPLNIKWWRHQMEILSGYWPFVRGIHRWPVNSPHKGQWRGALTFSLICAWINGWVNNREAGDLRRHRAHYDVIVMRLCKTKLVAGHADKWPLLLTWFNFNPSMDK